MFQLLYKLEHSIQVESLYCVIVRSASFCMCVSQKPVLLKHSVSHDIISSLILEHRLSLNLNVSFLGAQNLPNYIIMYRVTHQADLKVFFTL